MSSLADGSPRRAAACCAALLLTACGDDATSPEPWKPANDPAVTYGTLVVTVRTTGDGPGDADPDGYYVRVARSGTRVALARTRSNDTLSLDAPIGRVEIRFGDVAENCAIAGGDVLSVEVARAAKVPLQLEVACRHWPAQSAGLDGILGDWRVVRVEEAALPDFSIGTYQLYGFDTPVQLRIVRTADARVRWEWRRPRSGGDTSVVTGTGTMLEGGVLRSVADPSEYLSFIRSWGMVYDFELEGDLFVERAGALLVMRRMQPGYHTRDEPSWTRVTLEPDIGGR